jgi:hypothetical protein
MSYRVAHVEAIHVTAAAGTALTNANKLEGLKSFPVTTATTLVEQQHLNSDGWSRHVPTWKSASGSLSGEVKAGSATQAILQTADDNSTPFFVHVIENASAAPGAKMGRRYEMVIESSEEPHEAGGLVTFNYSVKVNGPPVDILAPNP